MSDLPWMQVFIGTEAALTVDLTAEEFGAYERLRRHYWQHQGLPNDDRRLMRITGVDPDRWEDVRSAICGLFEEGWRLPRLDEERKAASLKRKNAVEKSQKAHAARYGKMSRAPSTAPSTSTGNTPSDAPSTATDLPEAMPVACPSASDEVRYDERLSPTRVHARGADEYGEVPHERPETDSEGRAFLRRRGLPPRQVEALLGPLMDGRLLDSQIDQVLMH